jgi:hypothetical protein
LLCRKPVAKATGRYELVFAGRVDRQRPMSENTINKCFADMGYKGRLTGHGLTEELLVLPRPKDVFSKRKGRNVALPETHRSTLRGLDARGPYRSWIATGAA